MKKRGISFLLSLIFVFATVTNAFAAASHSTSDVYPFPGFDGPDSDAIAQLTRNTSGVTMSLHTSNLEPGAAYTTWWVVFNNPTACLFPTGIDGNCGEGDIFLADGSPNFSQWEEAQISVLYAAGHVIGKNGRANFAASLSENDTTGSLFGPGLINAELAEIHIIVRSHGAPIPGMVPEQIHTFGGGCTPATGGTVEDGNDCADPQFAIFSP